MVNVFTGLSNFKNVNNLGVDKFETLPLDLKKIISVVSKKLWKISVQKKLNKKVYNLDNKTPDATNFIHIKRNNTDKKSFEKKWEMLIKKMSHINESTTSH